MQLANVRQLCNGNKLVISLPLTPSFTLLAAAVARSEAAVRRRHDIWAAHDLVSAAALVRPTSIFPGIMELGQPCQGGGCSGTLPQLLLARPAAARRLPAHHPGRRQRSCAPASAPSAMPSAPLAALTPCALHRPPRAPLRPPTSRSPPAAAVVPMAPPRPCVVACSPALLLPPVHPSPPRRRFARLLLRSPVSLRAARRLRGGQLLQDCGHGARGDADAAESHSAQQACRPEAALDG